MQRITFCTEFTVGVRTKDQFQEEFKPRDSRSDWPQFESDVSRAPQRNAAECSAKDRSTDVVLSLTMPVEMSGLLLFKMAVIVTNFEIGIHWRIKLEKK